MRRRLTARTPNQMILKFEYYKRITDSGCWLWTGAVTSSGYGDVRYNGEKWQVHRLSVYLYKPTQYTTFGLVCHTCNTSRCFNPEHLYMGTASSNQLDFVKTGAHHLASKKFCKRGHEFTQENTRVLSTGNRSCIQCEKMRALYKSFMRGK